MEFESATGRVPRTVPRMAGVGSTLNLPVGVVAAGPVFFIIIGALVVVLLNSAGILPTNTEAVPTAGDTPTPSQTPQPTETGAPTFTPSPLPPIEITVQEGETCLGYSVKYSVPSNEIIKLNDLAADCTDLRIGQRLLIPQPTPTQPPPATATHNAAEQTRSACELFSYEVKEGDTLSIIADTYNVSIESLKEWNQNIVGDTLFSGLTIDVPLCERLPTPGPTPTPTVPPPHPPPNLLTPRDGVVYGSSAESIALQWASVASLRENEVYQVTLEDISLEESNAWVDYVSDTRYIVPDSQQPKDNAVHIFRWSVSVVRQTGSTDAGEPVYTSAGASSEWRVFAWGGLPPTEPTPNP